MTSRKRYKNGADGGTGVYMQEGTTSRVTAADKPYGDFYYFYSVIPEYFGYSLLYQFVRLSNVLQRKYMDQLKITSCVLSQ
jgi:hypothetical protein